ncbi:hypothetical protein CC86DRAFT_174082 [Ophiobolus disseminans]|uniref:Uncharacterized protein n=1 Tax=Ophiobolus disseminans TaxID=1469910 RepID=A0A6A7AAJ5_9PLEO|nr:hypothetical protein CC86DRAFT_174082 [Ophiobolus disseminans]
MGDGGYRTAFNLQLDIKLHVLQKPDATTCYTGNAARSAHHGKLDRLLSELLHVDYEARPKEVRKYYVGAAKRCRDTRERMNKRECTAIGARVCVYNTLLPMLDATRGSSPWVGSGWASKGL